MTDVLSSSGVTKSRRPWPRLALGTVQFGYAYGVTQSSVARDDVAATLARAWDLGVDLLDTAPVYGQSEAIIGAEMPKNARFEFITKTVALRQKQISLADVENVVARARRSAEQLRTRPLNAILVHESEDLLCVGSDRLIAALQKLRDEGLVRRIGVSVYDPTTLDAITERHEIQVIQLPLNVFDQRFVQDGRIWRLVDRGIEIHARSVFLQGLLLQEPANMPARFLKACEPVSRFQDEMKSLGLSAIEGAILFAGSQEGVSRLVIGVEGIASLEADIDAMRAAAAFKGRVDFGKFAVDDPEISDPRRWKS